MAALLLASAAGKALAAPNCPQAADIVRSLYPHASAPDQEGDMKLGDGQGKTIVSETEYSSSPRVVCKVWPANESLLLAAVPLMEDQPQNPGGNNGDLAVYVLDRETLKPRQSLRIHGLMSDDAIQIVGLSLDTARYEADGERAFGVRIMREGSSRANPFSETSLRLFVPDGDQLRMVLGGLLMDRSTGEWDTTCAGRFSETHLTLAMNGRNLIATEKTEESRAGVKDKDCVESTVSQGKKRHTLPYQDGQFHIPVDMVSMDNEYSG